jgi:hypothetical protein
MLIGIFLLVIGDFSQAKEQYNNAVSVAAQADTTGAAEGAGEAVGGYNEKEKEKKRFRFLLGVLFVFIVALFAMLLVISLLRASRFQKQRLQIGKKSEPTDYVDAWSQYRLDEEDIDSEPPH